MKNRGISAVVATVLIILITVVTVSLVWASVAPIIRDNLDFRSFQGTVDIVTSGGYTFYDPDTKLASVQVERSMDEENMPKILIVFHFQGDSIQSSVIAPAPGNTRVYIFNLSDYGFPDAVSVGPIFALGNKEKSGVITIVGGIREGEVDEIGVVYEIGRDYNGRSCLDLKNMGYDVDGVYEIDPDGEGGGMDSFLVNCDMTRDGGGWTQIIKTWNFVPLSSNVFRKSEAVGDVSDGLVHLGNGYKLSDWQIRGIIGPSKKFSVLSDQTGYHDGFTGSTGNYEYVILRNYTGHWRFDNLVLPSTSTTVFQSYRASDGALAWTGNLLCGQNVGYGTAGINCFDVLDNNPMGGAGCDINMGKYSNTGVHHFFMSYDQTPYIFICNGMQYSSVDRFSNRFWVREG